MKYHSGFDNYRAILVGVSNYSALPSVPAALNSIKAIQGVLCDPTLCGWPPERITVISDPGSVPELGEQIAELAKETAGLLLLYYVGHGLLDEQGNLYLTVVNTNPDNPRYSGVPWSNLSDDVRKCPARMRLAILDCCFAGQAIEVLGSNAEPSLIPDITHIKGAYTLTATIRNRLASVPPPEQQAEASTSFTGELYDLIRTGIPSKPTWLTFSDIYPALSQRMRAKGLPAPNQRGTDTAPEHAFTRNAALSHDLASDESIAAVINARKAGMAVARALLYAIARAAAMAALNAKARDLVREPASERDDGGRPAGMFRRAGDAARNILRYTASESAQSAAIKLSSDRDRALAHARAHASDLVQALAQASELDHHRSNALASASSFALDLVKRLSSSEFRDLADSSAQAMANASSKTLIKVLTNMRMDVSGRDLSNLGGTEQDNLNALFGVIWNEETIWPPAWEESVYQWSHEIRPGVRRIYKSAVGSLAASALEASQASE